MGNHKIEIRRTNVDKILLAAEKVFAEKGFGGTAMADIAAEVQLPPALQQAERAVSRQGVPSLDEVERTTILQALAQRRALQIWHWHGASS